MRPDMPSLKEFLSTKYNNANGVFARGLPGKSLVFSDMQYIERAEVRYTTSFYEFRQTEKILADIVQNTGISSLAVPKISDFGAGDGRIFKILKKLCPGLQYAGVEYDYPNARKLAALDESLVSICDDACSVEFPGDYFDLSLAWGLFHNFNDQQYRACSKKIMACTRNGGHVVLAEPTLESVLLYSLVKRDISEFIRIYNTKTRPAMWEDKDERYNVNFINQTRALIANEAALKVVLEYGVDIWPSLIFGNILQDADADDDTLRELERIVNDYGENRPPGGYAPRTAVYVCKAAKEGML
jgi:hypothetical protein